MCPLPAPFVRFMIKWRTRVCSWIARRVLENPSLRSLASSAIFLSDPLMAFVKATNVARLRRAPF